MIKQKRGWKWMLVMGWYSVLLNKQLLLLSAAVWSDIFCDMKRRRQYFFFEQDYLFCGKRGRNMNVLTNKWNSYTWMQSGLQFAAFFKLGKNIVGYVQSTSGIDGRFFLPNLSCFMTMSFIGAAVAGRERQMKFIFHQCTNHINILTLRLFFCERGAMGE